MIAESSSGVALLGAALVMGLLGSPHCVGMCGGLSVALTPVEPGRRFAGAALLAIGRVATYAALGLAVGGLGGAAADAVGLPGGMVLRAALGGVLILIGASIAGLWPGALLWLERIGAGVWRRVAPLAGGLGGGPPGGVRALLAGALWGLLPCGLVYAALAGAAASGSALGGAGFMLAFGLGTLPAVVATGAFGAQLRTVVGRRAVRGVAGATLMIAGAWTLAAPIAMQAMHGAHGAAEPSAHAHQHPS